VVAAEAEEKTKSPKNRKEVSIRVFIFMIILYQERV
jgi:hypothetical protein